MKTANGNGATWCSARRNIPNRRHVFPHATSVTVWIGALAYRSQPSIMLYSRRRSSAEGAHARNHMRPSRQVRKCAQRAPLARGSWLAMCSRRCHVISVPVLVLVVDLQESGSLFEYCIISICIPVHCLKIYTHNTATGHRGHTARGIRQGGPSGGARAPDNKQASSERAAAAHTHTP